MHKDPALCELLQREKIATETILLKQRRQKGHIAKYFIMINEATAQPKEEQNGKIYYIIVSFLIPKLDKLLEKALNKIGMKFMFSL